MRRRIITALLVLVCFLLQSTLFQTLSFAGIVPNLLVILTASLGFLRGEREGMAVGFFSGLLVDIFFGRQFGFYSLLYLSLGYGSGLFHMMFYDEDIKLPMIWTAAADLLYGLCVYFFQFVLRSRFAFDYYLVHIILPELVYTVLVTIVIYRPIRALYRWLEEKEEAGEEHPMILPAESGGTDNQTEEHEI